MMTKDEINNQETNKSEVREWQLDVYCNSKDPRQLCFVDSRTAPAIPHPKDCGKWQRKDSLSDKLRGSIAYGINVSEVRREITKKGYALRKYSRIFRPA